MLAQGWYALSGPRIGVMLTTTGPTSGAASGFGNLAEPRSPWTPGFVCPWPVRPGADVAKNARATAATPTNRTTKNRSPKKDGCEVGFFFPFFFPIANNLFFQRVGGADPFLRFRFCSSAPAPPL